MNQPLVSVIIPVYNTNTSAVRLISALLKDPYQNLEIIVIDDGSTDHTLKLLQDFHTSAKDPRLKIIHQKNQGASSARNHGINISRGEYLLFIDSDDEITKDFITDLVNTIQKPATALSATGYTYHRVKQRKTFPVAIKPLRKQGKNETFKAYIIYSLCVDPKLYSSVNKIYHADVIRKHRLHFDEKLNFAEDTKFVLDYLKYAPGDIKYVLKPAYIYHFGTETSTVKKSGTKWSNWRHSFKNVKNWVGKRPTPRERFWLFILISRWHIAYLLSRWRSR